MRNMFSKRMDNRGQISAEYLLLMVIIILILSSVTIPLASKSIDSSNDVSQASDAKVYVTGLADAVNAVYANGPGSKRVVNVYLPQDNMVFARGGTTLNLTVKLSDGTTKLITANTEYPVYSYTYTLPKKWYKYYVIWKPGENAITITTNPV